MSSYKVVVVVVVVDGSRIFLFLTIKQRHHQHKKQLG